MDAGLLWFHDDPGIKSSASGQTESGTERTETDSSAAAGKRSTGNAAGSGKEKSESQGKTFRCFAGDCEAKRKRHGRSFLGAGKGAVWRYHASCTGNGRKGYRKAGKHADLPRSAGSDDLPVQSKAGRGKNADRQRLFSERRTAAGSPNDFKRVGSER